jgi:CBS domain-containing protein
MGMTVGNYCERNLALLTRDASLQEAAMMMRTHHVGQVTVIDKLNGKNIPVGMVTDRDLVIEIMALDVDVEQISVGNIMSLELITACQDCSLSDTLDIMQRHGVRRLPVVDNNGALLGIINIEGILNILCQDMSKLLTLFNNERGNEKTLRS